MNRNTVPRPPAVVYWVTRDRLYEGQLCDWVGVWTERPTRTSCGLGGYWRSATGEGLDGYVQSMWPLDAWRVLGCVPDDDLMLVRVERNAAIPGHAST